VTSPFAYQPEHETQVECHRCNNLITVSGYIDDLPDPYTCLGCRTVKREPGDPIPYNQFPATY
jgi:hypothetical protein